MNLPSIKTTVETLQLKQDAQPYVDMFIQRNTELEEIYEVVQPLLYEMSVKLYGDSKETVLLAKLVEDAVAFLKGETNV